MSVGYGTSLVNDSLVFCLDAANPKSYIGDGDWYDLIKDNNGTNYGPTYSSDYGGIFLFDRASSHYFYIGNPAELSLGSNFTVEAWVRADADAWMYFLYNGYNQNNSFWMGTHPTANAWWHGTYYNTSYNYLSNGTDSVEIGVWTRCALTFDGAKFNCYINKEHTVTDDLWSNDAFSNPSTGIQIGSSSGSRAWEGAIAVIKVYNTVLSEIELDRNYDALKGRFGL